VPQGFLEFSNSKKVPSLFGASCARAGTGGTRDFESLFRLHSQSDCNVGRTIEHFDEAIAKQTMELAVRAPEAEHKYLAVEKG
jgi:hypothetical protein